LAPPTPQTAIPRQNPTAETISAPVSALHQLPHEVGVFTEGAAMLKLFSFGIGYVLVIAMLLALNYALHRWNHEDADEAARREVERFRAFLPPGDSDRYNRPR
jgi:hypothetical protein